MTYAPGSDAQGMRDVQGVRDACLLHGPQEPAACKHCMCDNSKTHQHHPSAASAWNAAHTSSHRHSMSRAAYRSKRCLPQGKALSRSWMAKT